MKYIKIFCFLIIFSYSCNSNSQIILTRGINNGNLPQNFKSSGQYYYKDVNNYLNNFIGTWEYTNGAEKFQIILTKIVNYHIVDSELDLNYYEDGITLQYKKFINDNLVFESPLQDNPNFSSSDGILLKGYVLDYGRITKTVNFGLPPNEISKEGGEPISPICYIKKVSDNPNKLTFSLNLGEEIGYDHSTYTGQATFSIPENIILNKLN